ncbi:EmrA/EmrK family multidrug efflux transporter periplasmic adaptor subunit [Aquifex pyrophilus]
MKKWAGVSILVLIMFAFSVYAFLWIKHRMEYAVSNAVFVKADRLSYLSFNVSGTVLEVYKDLGDLVKKGEVLAVLDPEYYELELKSLEKKLSALEEKKKALEIRREKLERELRIRLKKERLTASEVRKEIEALRKKLKELNIKLELLEKDRERYRALFEEGLIPKRRYEGIDTEYKALLEEREFLKKKLERLEISYRKALKGIELVKNAFKSVEELDRELKSLWEEIKSLERRRDIARKRLEDTRLTAPFDGVVAKRFISEGDTVRAGQPAFALIDPRSFYIEVLLEETKLEGVKKGSKAYVRLDAYPDKVFEGVVEEISPASAATFALVPRDVSAGEFTKVVQRIPVKIRITKGDIRLLRVGMGGEVEIRRER